MLCTIESCNEQATSHIALVTLEQVFEKYFCDSHGNEYVNQAMRERSLDKQGAIHLEGVACCELCLIMNRPNANQHYLHLEEKGTHRWLGVYTGYVDTALVLATVSTPSPPRPFTHDTINRVIQSFGGQIKHVLIHSAYQDDRLSDQPIYLADLMIDGPDGDVTIDIRPSDAVSLSIRCGTPIFVSEQLLQDG